jgi:SAM-dependent methyltransferase
MIDYLLLLIATFLLAAACSYAYAGWRFAPWVPSYQKDLDRALKLADLKAGETFIDLGCGDGRVVIEAAEKFGADASGYEIALPMIAVLMLRRKRERVRYFYKSLFDADLSKADVVYLFGTPPTLRGKLTAKLERELKPGARVISYTFSLEGWEPKAVDRPDPKSLPIRLYVR